jgi:hypothetical protein
MTHKLIFVFAILALAHATVEVNSPASVFAVTPGLLFTNATDAAFTSLTGPCYFSGGVDNTTNYVWCQTADVTSAVAYTYQRRAINSTSPATINATLDTKIATTHVDETLGSVVTCSGPGYFGIATSYGSGTGPNYKPDVSFSYIAVNGSSATKVALTANSDANMYVKPQQCLYDAGIFYIIYTQYHYIQSSTGVNLTQNAVYIHAVNVTSGAVFYNATGGVKILSPTTQDISTLTFSALVGNNATGYATKALLLYTDASSVTSTVGSKYCVLPITLSSGAPDSVQVLATGATSTVVVSTATITPKALTSTSSAGDTASVTFTSTAAAAITTSVTSTLVTDYSLVGAFGALSTYGVALTQSINTVETQQLIDSDAYTNSFYINGSATASATMNLTNPTGYTLAATRGASTADGFVLFNYYAPTSGSTYLVNKDTYYANGTAITSLSTGTYQSIPTVFSDATGSPWFGYYVEDSANSTFPLVSAYAGEAVWVELSANSLTTIFATLTLMIAALFAF